MKTFNKTRFLNVAKWDLAINRSFYQKAVIMIFFIMAVPLILSMLGTLASWLFTGTVPAVQFNTVSFVGMVYIFIYALPFICGYMFHNLLTKQSRIGELTLPASNMEKFVWHALLTIGGSILVALVSTVILDAVQMLYVGVLSGFDQARSNVWHMFTDIKEAVVFFKTINLPNFGHAIALWFLFYVFNLSVFALGNAIKYKHNIILTLLFQFGVGIGVFLCAAFGLAFIVHNYDGQNPDPVMFQFFENIPLVAINYVIVLGLISLCWWATYHFYSRAQITTKRNK